MQLDLPFGGSLGPRWGWRLWAPAASQSGGRPGCPGRCHSAQTEPRPRGTCQLPSDLWAMLTILQTPHT